MQNSNIDCSKFNFFDSFSGIDFKFIMTDTVDYISYTPEMLIYSFDPRTEREIRFG